MLKKSILAAGITMGLAAGTAQANVFADCVATPIIEFEGSIVDAAVATPELSTLVTAVTAAGLVDTLASANNITVFAPTDNAFAALEGPILDTVLASQELLTGVLTYHVAPGIQDPRRWIKSVRRETLSGESVFYHFKDGAPMVNGASIDCQGVRTDNGIVWVIDSVLMPPLRWMM